MGFRDIVVNAVRTAHRLTGNLQCAFTLEKKTGSNADGEATYAVATSHTGVVSYRVERQVSPTGLETLQAVVITVPYDLDVTIGDRVVITAPVPFSAPIVAVRGELDPVTKRPYAAQLYLGDKAGAAAQ